MTLPEKGHPPLFQQPSSKTCDLANVPLFANLVGGSTPPSRKGGAHYA